MSGLWLISYIALWVLVILLTTVVLGLVRQLGLIYLRLGPEQNVLATKEGLELGSPAPDFRATDIVHGKEITLPDLKGRQSVLVFVSSSCSPCLELMPHIAAAQRSWDGKVNIVLFSQGSAQANLDLANDHKLKTLVLSDPTGTISTAYKVRATPFAYRLDKDGLVRRRGIVNKLEDLEALLEDASPSEAVVELPNPEKEKTPSQVQ